MTMVVLMDAMRMIRTMKEGRRVRVFDMVNMVINQVYDDVGRRRTEPSIVPLKAHVVLIYLKR